MMTRYWSKQLPHELIQQCMRERYFIRIIQMKTSTKAILSVVIFIIVATIVYILCNTGDMGDGQFFGTIFIGPLMILALLAWVYKILMEM